MEALPVGFYNSWYTSVGSVALVGVVVLIVAALMFWHVRFHYLLALLVILTSIGVYPLSIASPAPMNVMGLVLPCLVIGLARGGLGIVWNPTSSRPWTSSGTPG
ncbi:MAG: hypothetical protein WCB19_02525 [Thermoplasmata archaeon]